MPNDISTAPGAAPVIPTIEAPTQRLAIPAQNALGLDEPPGRTLEALTQSNNDRQIKPAIADPTTSRPTTPLPPKPPKAPAAPKSAPVAPAAPAAPAPAPAAPAKFKIGGKEYTEEDLQRVLAQREAPAQDPAPAPAAPAPEAPQPPKELTPEEIEAEASAWTDAAAETIPVNITEQDIETILAGGKDSVETVTKLLKKSAARAVLEARKSVLETLNKELVPSLGKMREEHEQLYNNFQEVRRYETERAFVTQYPEFEQYRDRAREVGEALVKNYPAEIGQMNQEQFMAEVARQTDRILSGEFKRWNPTYQGTWRDYVKAQQTPAAPAAPAPVAPAAPASVVVQAQPIPPVRPPTPNLPSVPPAAAATSWHTGVNASMRPGGLPPLPTR